MRLHFVAVAVLPIILLGIFSLNYFRQKHLETISTLVDAHALNVSAAAKAFLDDASSALALIAAMSGAADFNDEENMARHLQSAIDTAKSFESIYLLDTQQKIINLALSARNSGSRSDYLGLDLSSHAIFSAGPILEKPVWSDVFQSAVTVEPSVTLGSPVTGGTLLGTVSLQKISEELVDRLGRTAYGFAFSLIDHNGTLLADSKPQRAELPPNLRMHAEVRAALDNHVEISSAFRDGNPLLESVRLVPGAGWAVYVSLPVEEALQSLTPLRYALFSMLTFAALLGVTLSFWLSRWVLRPILVLRDAASAVAQGNYNQVLPIVRYEELEDLSGSFRDMIAAVEERELSNSENRARFEELVNSIDGIVWELNPADLRFTFVSDQAERILGYPVKNWLEDEDFWPRHIQSDDRDRVISFCNTETMAQRDHDFEYRMIAADGTTVWLRNLATVIIDNGQPVRLSGVMLDITSRKSAELELQQTTGRLRLLIDRMPLACIVWGEDRRVELWNPEAEKIFGYSEDEVLGKRPFDFLFADPVREEGRNVIQRLAEKELLAHDITENQTRDGRTIVCEWHNTPLLSPDGRNIGAISMVNDITERVDAEAALKESELRFRTVFETNPDAVLITRLNDSAILSVNDYCLTLSGYDREELLGRTTLELGLWADPDERDNYMALVREYGKVENFEMKLLTKNDRQRIGLASARILILNDEQCLLNVVRDITEMKEAEARMMRSELRFRSLVSVLGEGIIILGFNGEIVQCNEAAERILQVNAEEVIGLLHDEVFNGAVREDGSLLPITDSPSMQTLQSGKPVVNQVLGLPGNDGQVVWVQMNSYALGLGKSGQPLAVVVSFADVTSLKEIEKELRDNEKHLQTLSRQIQGVLEAIPDRILILDRDMQVIWLNWSEGSHDPASNLASRNLLCHQLSGVECGPSAKSDTAPCNNCPVRKTFATGRTETVQKELADGRTLALRTFPVFNEDQEVVNVIMIAQDITEELHQQSQTMRTGQLAALGELAAGVAHEINNPINGVINYAQLILNKAVADSREQELSKRIIKESERIATIVRELLYFAREESEEISRITVRAALDEALALMRHRMNKEGIILQIRLPDNLPMIESRSHQIQRLFLNLITNASYALMEKYPDTDPDKILMITGELLQKNEQLMVRVVFRDHGVGIPEDLLDRVVNPFVTTKPSGEGTGLGLSISHEIVQKHRGSLTIKSVFGEYTEVIVELPAN